MTITQIKTCRFHGLNLTATESLLTLANLGQTDMSGLAAELCVSSASITNIVERLIKDRLVIRSYSRDDRRVIYINLTELGASRVHAITGRPVTMPVTTPITAVPALGLRYSR